MKHGGVTSAIMLLPHGASPADAAAPAFMQRWVRADGPRAATRQMGSHATRMQQPPATWPPRPAAPSCGKRGTVFAGSSKHATPSHMHGARMHAWPPPRCPALGWSAHLPAPLIPCPS